MQNIINTIRSKSDVIATQSPQYPDKDYMPLPNDVGNQDDYIFDTTGSEPAVVEEDSFSCPATLEEMMSIVRKLRIQRKDAIREFEFKDPIMATSGGISRSKSDNHNRSSTTSSSVSKSRANNYDKVFA